MIKHLLIKANKRVAFILLLGLMSTTVFAQIPPVEVRFANPTFNCFDSTYCLDVQLRSNTSNVELFGFNVRFFYDDDILEFDTLTNFVGGYSERSSSGTGIFTGTPTSGASLFGFGGAAEYANLVVELTNTSLPVAMASGAGQWTTFFQACFTVDLISNPLSFCPSVVWERDRTNTTGILMGSDGIVVTATQAGNPALSRPTLETAVQYNWAYNAGPGIPYGATQSTSCIIITCNEIYALNDINNTYENTPVSGNVLTNDNDPQDDLMTVNTTPFVLPSNGTVILNADGTYTYSPAPGFVGEDEFQYIVCDDNAIQACDTATVFIEVIGPDGPNNQPPIANPDVAQTDINVPVDGDLLTNDFDPDGDPITINTTPLSNPTNGTVVINPDGTFTYTPNADFYGEDTFEYIICDNGAPALCDTTTATIYIYPDYNGDNDTYANDDAYNTNINTNVVGNISDNDFDPEGNTQTVVLIPLSGPSNGAVTINGDGSFTYIPNTDYYGTDQFVYITCDNGSPIACDTATVYITLDPLVPVLEISKEIYSARASAPNPNEYDLTYLLHVRNIGTGEGEYNLMDTLKFGAGVSVVTVSTSYLGGDGQQGSIAGFSGPYGTISAAEITGPAATDSFLVSVRVLVDPAIAQANEVDCDLNTGSATSTGLMNCVVLNVNDTTGTSVRDTVCADLPDCPEIVSIDTTQVTDCNTSNGTITIHASSNAGGIQYSINAGLTWNADSMFTSLPIGTYEPAIRVLNTTVNCLIFGEEIILYAPVTPTFTNAILTNPTDCGLNDGSITVLAGGGAGPLEYTIDGGLNWQASTFFPNLYAGFYDIRIRNQSGTCEITGGIVQLNDPAAPSLDSVSSNNPSGCGAEDGMIDIHASGGQASYEYSIDSGLNWLSASTYTGLSNGTYYIMVKNANNTCPIGLITVILTSTEPPIVGIPTLVNPDCTNPGSITIHTTGGLYPLQHSIDGTTWQWDSTFNNLSIGRYPIFVRNWDVTCVTEGDSVDLINGCILPPDTIWEIVDMSTPKQICVDTTELPYNVVSMLTCDVPNFGANSGLIPPCFIYTPINNYVGPDSTCIVVCDDQGTCDTTYIFIKVIPPIDTIPITLHPMEKDTLCLDSVINLTGTPASYAWCDLPDSVTLTQIGPISCLELDPYSTWLGQDTACIIHCRDIDGVSYCDTTIIIITVEPRCIDIETYVWLEGGLIDPQGSITYSAEMRTDLNTGRVLPGQTYTDPFLGTVYSPTGQPYNQAPWNYAGTEGDAFDSGGSAFPGTASYPTDVVDWVLVYLRSNPNDTSTAGKLCQRAGLLHKDGSITFPQIQCCEIDINLSYYLVIEHRNHMIVMSDQAISIIAGKITYDFRIQESYIDDPFFFGTFKGQKQVALGKFAMYGGNGDQVQTLDSDTDINLNDRTFWEGENGTIGKYRIGDYNLNIDVNFNDRKLFEINNGIFTSVPR